MALVRGTPESRVQGAGTYRFDVKGIATFMVAMIALQIFLTQGSTLGWLSPAALGLLVVALVVGVLFVRVETGNPDAFVDFRLFRNRTYTGATISNLPDDQAGAGSGIYKMASSLGASFGVAISAAIFTALSAEPSGTGPGGWLEGVITFTGRQDNVGVRTAAFYAFAANLLMIVAAIVSILVLIRKGRKTEDAHEPRPDGRRGAPEPRSRT
jgi:hypothetical protein